MKMLMAGLTGWARMEKTNNQMIKGVDAGITMVGTMLVAVTWMLMHG